MEKVGFTCPHSSICIEQRIWFGLGCLCEGPHDNRAPSVPSYGALQRGHENSFRLQRCLTNSERRKPSLHMPVALSSDYGKIKLLLGFPQK
jgi:hypothetical protein